MQTIIVGGAQFGDEGKGKITYYLARESDVSIRCNGGSNAEHTFVHEGRTLRFRMLPIGLMQGNLALVTGNVILGLDLLARDLETAGALLGDLRGKLLISEAAHLALPRHVDFCQSRNKHLGTIGQGVGPANADRKLRRGTSLRQFLTGDLGEHAELPESLVRVLESLRPYVGSATAALAERRRANPDLRVLVEGSQGFMLDNLYGTYPYVTSAETSSAALIHGAGVPCSSVVRNIGVTKTYLTRYSVGPFVTRCEPESERWLQERGQEFGTPPDVRPIDCGWFDLVAMRFAQEINGYTELSLNKLDVLSGLERIPVCIGYRYKGEVRTHVHEWSHLQSDELQPVYRYLQGWSQELRGATLFEELPKEARDYVRFLEDALEVPIRLIGTGPANEHLIDRGI